jgi:hypothetical protein
MFRLLGILRNCKFVWLQRKIFVAACTDDFNTSVSFENRVKDLNGGVYNCAPISYNVSFERTRRVCPRL